MHTTVDSSRAHFGRFQFDASSGELYKDGRRVRLQEHPRLVLVALLERPGEIVTRDELRLRLWKADTFVDFEHGVNTAVKKLRQALGDAAESPSFIETLPRRGYRFVGRLDLPVTPGDDSDGLAPAVVAPAPHDTDWRRRPVVWATCAFLVAVLGVTAWLVRRSTNPQEPKPSAHPAAAQLAVMPFRVLGESSSAMPYLGVGIADAITTRLANTRAIALRPTSAVLPFHNAQADPAKVAAALAVQHVLVGTIQPVDQIYRVSVQLVGKDGVAVWGRTFDEPRAALLDLQDHIAEQVASALRVELSGAERAVLHVRHTDNPAAYDMYLRGRSLLVNYTEANMREAISYFERALSLDQDYALARAGIATASAWFSVRYAYENEALAWGKRADEEARHALDQDAALADAHFAIASAAGTLYGGFEWPVVLDRTAAALSIDRSLDLAHLARMRAYYHLGLFGQAREEARLARELNPNPNVEMARLEIAMELFDGQFTRALERAGALLPRTDAPAVRHYLGLARYYTGDASGARDMLSSAMRGGRPDARSQASLASIEAATGRASDARARIATILRGPYMDHHVAYSLGAAFAQLGDVTESLDWLERAAATGFPCYPWFERDQLLEPLRRDPGFARLLARLREAHVTHRRAATGN
jgi:DNA-binding winged helix-turn-helix (wHTH) protein/TolB-like protein/Tfp pilus assembly protein PilF